MLEKFKTIWQSIYTESKRFYSGLTQGRKIILFVGFAALVISLVFAATWRPSVSFEVAYTNLSAEDKTAILAQLKKANIKEFNLEGDSILFPQDKIQEIKMMLAQEGLPTSGIGGGWEKFDEHSFGMSDFDQRINKLRALQGELSRTINRLDPVANSRVHIVLPENALFASEKKSPSASIYLKLKRGQVLSKQQVQGVLHLVARAVEGLQPQDITIVDQEGAMLTQPPEEDGGLDKVTSVQRDYQKRVEKELEQKIKDILTRFVGQDKVVSKVQATIDFKKVETTISDVDPERTAVIASQRNEQSSQGNGLNPTGVPGAKSNLPGEREDTGNAGGLSNSTKSNTENLNFDVKKTISKIVEPVGNVVKLTASVLVDGKIADGKFALRSKEDIEVITKLVKNAIGFQEGRDFLTVESAQFEPDAFAAAEQAAAAAKQVNLWQTGMIAFAGIAAMVFIYFAFVRQYFRWLTHDPNKRSKELNEVFEYEFERAGSKAKRVQMQEEVPFEKLTPKEQILYLARHDPKKTTEAIRQLLNPHS